MTDRDLLDDQIAYYRARAAEYDERRHDLWDEDWIDRAVGVVRRPLNDGTAHRAVKVL